MLRVLYYVFCVSNLFLFGYVKMEDGFIKDGFIDVYDQFYMGNCVENMVKKYKFICEE